MSKLIKMLKIGICPIGYLIMQESGLNLKGLVPGTRVDWIGKDWIRKKRTGLERTGLERIDSKG